MVFSIFQPDQQNIPGAQKAGSARLWDLSEEKPALVVEDNLEL